MPRRVLIILLTLALAALACSLPRAVPMVSGTPPMAFPTATPGLVPTTPVQTPGSGPGAEPSFGPVVLFSTMPDAQTARRIFPAGTEEVFAMWEYHNMREGLSVRREWYLDGALWLEREEPWDFARYGADGMVTDVSVYDRIEGLAPGQYELYLYIDGVPQYNEEIGQISFTIDAQYVVSPATSPDGARTALVQGGGRLFIEEGGARRELISTVQIHSLAWFPDSRHLIYTEADTSEVQFGTVGIKYTLWVIDVETGEQHALNAGEAAYHYPAVSPDGRYVAMYAGSGYGDACGVDLDLAFIRLDDDRQAVEVIRTDDFAGLPPAQTGSRYPFAQDDLPAPGVWRGPAQFEMGFAWACADPDPAGVYLLDLAARSAQRTGDLVRNEG